MEESEKEAKKNGTVVIVLVIIILLLAAGVYLFFIKKPDTSVDNNSNNNSNNSSNNSSSNNESVEKTDLEFKSQDGKYTLKLLASGEVYLNDREIVSIDMEEDDRYIEIDGDIYPSPNYEFMLRFVLDKETKLIVERPIDDWNTNRDGCGYSAYGEYARFCIQCMHFDVLTINNWYFFEVISDDGPSEIYTTGWKKLGWISEFSDNYKYDNKGIYVCNKNFNESEDETCDGNETKYDVNGNVVTD